LLDATLASSAPMGPAPRADEPPPSLVYERALGSNVVDADGNRFVDLAAGFGALILGHGSPAVVRAVQRQSERLMLALGDVFGSEVKAELVERLSGLYPGRGARVILAQSGADAVTAAVKTAALATGKPGLVAFRGSYHGLSYAPLAGTSLRSGYRDPFLEQLNPHVRFVDYPSEAGSLDAALTGTDEALRALGGGAVLIEPILGRGGVVVPPSGFLSSLTEVAHRRGALVIADEIWTGLGRSGAMLRSVSEGTVPDLVCLGKGLGGGVPISACIGSESVMRAWRRDDEVVHTSTFAGAPLACSAALATLDVLVDERLDVRSAELGGRWLAELRASTAGVASVVDVRGQGLMIGIDLGDRPASATAVQRTLLEKGYIASTGGGSRDVVVLTPPLDVAEPLLFDFIAPLVETLRGI
jgi:4-aminobutyrate aminotransferase/(S)-3-amino-2-methylpropionate transaminase